MEKPGKVIRYLSCFTVILLLFSILPATALAGNDKAVGNGANNGKQLVENLDDDDTGDAEDEDSDIETLQKKDKVKEKVQEKKLLKEDIKDRKREYQDAKGAFIKLRSKIRSGELDEDSPEAINGTKLYLNASVRYMISHLEGVQYNLNNANGNGTDARVAALGDRIALLKQEQERIQNAESYGEFSLVVKSVRGVWNNAQRDAALGAGQTVSEKMDVYLNDYENRSVKLNETIWELNQTGNDTTGLEINLTLYNELIGYARDNHTLAVEIYENENATAEDLEEANDILRTALDYIREANEVLEDIFSELQEYGIDFEKDQDD